MPRSYLESAVLSALPSFAEEWERLRATYRPGEPSATDFLAAVRTHVTWLLARGRVAEVSRLLHAVERLLAEADPILEELLSVHLVGRLAAESRELGVNGRLLLPHLGPHTRRAWEAGSGA